MKIDAFNGAPSLPRLARHNLSSVGGEGFLLDYFSKKGWTVAGADFSDAGMAKNFPEHLDKLRLGNLFNTIDQLIKEKQTYDIITCNNVLEHVKDPITFLKNIPKLLKQDGLLRISVPNDDSLLQSEVVRRGFAVKEYWKAVPDHLSYFNSDTFLNTLEKSGFKIVHYLADFPVEFFLFNPDSNYNKDQSLGKNCHYSRVMVENTLCQTDISKLIAFRKGCAKAGIGRVLTAYCRLQK